MAAFDGNFLRGKIVTRPHGNGGAETTALPTTSAVVIVGAGAFTGIDYNPTTGRARQVSNTLGGLVDHLAALARRTLNVATWIAHTLSISTPLSITTTNPVARVTDAPTVDTCFIIGTGKAAAGVGHTLAVDTGLKEATGNMRTAVYTHAAPTELAVRTVHVPTRIVSASTIDARLSRRTAIGLTAAGSTFTVDADGTGTAHRIDTGIRTHPGAGVTRLR